MVHGDDAITHYTVLEETPYNMSIVNVLLETGRTHQIRVHFSYIGHPIIGDTLYGSASSNISRQALHAYKVSFVHPVYKKEMNIYCDLPQDMNRFVLSSNIMNKMTSL